MNVVMIVTTRLACAAAVLGACGSPSVKHMTQQEMIAADPLPLAKIAALRKQASELVDRVQFDQGPTN